jgi:hypothetical protein
MKRYFKLVRKVDKEGLTAKDFTKIIYGDNPDWSEAIAAWWIYSEEGGKKLKYDDFLECIKQLLESEGYTPSDLVWQVATSCEKRPEDL